MERDDNQAVGASQMNKTKRKIKLNLFSKKQTFNLIKEETATPTQETQTLEPTVESSVKKQRRIGMAEKDEVERQKIKQDLKDLIKSEHMSEYNFT